MTLLFKIVYFAVCCIVLLYVLYPTRGFPVPPEGAVQSREPADTETTLRRAYFVNMNRSQIMMHYINEMGYLPSVRLNYPPEEAQTLIRDQTRSTYLEEIVHPLRESVYVNGFEPKDEKDAILIDDVSYEQKITVRYVPSGVLERVFFVLIASLLGYAIAVRFSQLLKVIMIAAVNFINRK